MEYPSRRSFTFPKQARFFSQFILTNPEVNQQDEIKWSAGPLREGK